MQNKITPILLIAAISIMIGLETWFLFHPDNKDIPFGWELGVPAILFIGAVVLSVVQIGGQRSDKWVTHVFLSITAMCAGWMVVSGLREEDLLKHVFQSYTQQQLVDSVSLTTSTYLRLKSAAFLFVAGTAFCAVIAQSPRSTSSIHLVQKRWIFRIALIVGILMAFNLFFIRFPTRWGWSNWILFNPHSRDGSTILLDLFHSWAFVLALFCTIAIPTFMGRFTATVKNWLWAPGLMLFGFVCLAKVLYINTAADILLAGQTSHYFMESALKGQWMAYFQPCALIFTGAVLFTLHIWPHRKKVKLWLVPLLYIGGVLLLSVLGIQAHNLIRTEIIKKGNKDCGIAEMIINLAAGDSKYRREYSDLFGQSPSYDYMNLPKAKAGQIVPDAIQTIITPSAILVQDMKIADLQNGIVDESLLGGPSGHEIFPLRDTLEVQLQHRKMMAARTNRPFEKKIVYLVDKTIPTRTVRQTMFTAQKQGFNTHMFVVRPYSDKRKLCRKVTASHAPSWTTLFDDTNQDKPFEILLNKADRD